MELLIKTEKGKEHFSDNHFHNFLGLFNVLTSFPFTTSETMRDYYLYELPHKLPNDLRLRILGNQEKLR